MPNCPRTNSQSVYSLYKFLAASAIALSSLCIVIPSQHISFAADTTPPVTSRTQTPASANGKNGWYITPVTFTLSATDTESGVQYIYYRIDSNPWQYMEFSNTLNLVANPSLEDYEEGSPFQTLYWDPVNSETGVVFTRDTSTYFTGFETTSVSISSTVPGWHAINNYDQFIPTTYLNNMNASAWIKTQNAQNAYFKIFGVDASGVVSATPLAESNHISGTSDWVQISANFIVNEATARGIIIEIGNEGTGTVWADAVTVTDALANSSIDVVVATDNANHTLEYYSVDRAGNAEYHTCSSPYTNCARFKLDQTPPGNWHDSGAFRGLFGPSYQLYVYTTVEDATSGISTFTDKYQYFTERNATFGRYNDILNCSSTWQSNTSVILISPPFLPGVHSAYLLTPKTSFCNTNWSSCKIVRFISEDLAGNVSTKDFCINGPWIKVSGEGMTHAISGIDMLAEANGDNSNGLISTGTNEIDFFTTSKNWYVKNFSSPDSLSYSDINELTLSSKTTISDNRLRNTAGLYKISGDFTINSTTLSQDFTGTNNAQIIFVDGDLRIDTNVGTANEATVLFVVSGKVEIAKTVSTINVGIISDEGIYTAYDLAEGEASSGLVSRGIYSAEKFYLQRTLQGTNNTNTPSEEFVYEPKHLIKLKPYFRTNNVQWRNMN